jgi:hypothetical protein
MYGLHLHGPEFRTDALNRPSYRVPEGGYFASEVTFTVVAFATARYNGQFSFHTSV